MLEATQQQATQAESQLEELQEQSSQIQVRGLSVLPPSLPRPCPSGSHHGSPGHWGAGVSYLENASWQQGRRGRAGGGYGSRAPGSSHCPSARRAASAPATLGNSFAHSELRLHPGLRGLQQVQLPAAGPGDAADPGTDGHRGGQVTGISTGPGWRAATSGPPGSPGSP